MLISGIIWGGFIGNKIFTELPANVGEIKDDGKELPSFGLVLGVILIPLVLILLSTLSKYMPLPAGIQDVLGFLGKPFLALTIATLAAMYFLGIRRGFSGAQLKKILDHSLRPVGMILLVIASGGVIRWMLQDSGLGNIIGPALEKSGLPLILIAFFIAILVRASVGSSDKNSNDNGIRNYGNHACSYGYQYALQSSNVLCYLWRCYSSEPCK